MVITTKERDFRFRTCLLVLAIHVIGATLVALKVPFPSDLDELAHYSYVRTIIETPLAMPGFGNFKLIDQESGHFSDIENYLHHPPLYYWLLAPVSTLAKYPQDIVLLRFSSTIVSTLSVAILLVAALIRLRDTNAFIVFAFLTGLTPMIGGLGGLINNDNLGLLATAIVFYALFVEPRLSLWRAVLLALGFMLAAGAKFNFGLAVGLIILLSHIPYVSQMRAPYIAIIGIFALVGIAPYLLSLIIHGSVLPPSPGFGRPEPDLNDWLSVSFADYLRHFVYRISTSWALFEPGDLIEVATLSVIVLLYIGYLLSSRRRQDFEFPVSLALVIYLVIHFLAIYRSFLLSGYPGGMQFRYFLAFWPFITLATAQSLACLPKWAFTTVSVPLVICTLYASAAVSVLRQWL